MNTQKIKEFFFPKTKFFILGVISALLIWAVLISSGVDILFKIIDTFVAFPYFIAIKLNYYGNGVGFIGIIWTFAIIYFFSCIFANLFNRKNISVKDNNLSTKNKLQFIKNILLIFIILLIFFLLVETIFGHGHSISKAKDSRIKSAIAQSRTVMNKIFLQSGNYDDFNCNSKIEKNMKLLCYEIDKNYGKIDGREPVISSGKNINSSSACIYSPLNPFKNDGWVYWIKNLFQKIETSKWYCADSFGSSGETNINPGGSGYCVEGISAVCPKIVGD